MELQHPVSKAVLSLDDDVEVCALLEHLLWPHRVIGVAHAYVALELLARECFDLFILDVRLPEMDGLQLCRRIRDDDPNVPIVICSGAMGPADQAEARRAGASLCHAKPFEPESFRSDIEQLLRTAEDRNRMAETLLREMLEASRVPAACASPLDEDSGCGALLERSMYSRFVAAGGTRAHFRRAWPAMLEKSVVAAPAVHAIPRVAGRHGG